MKISTPAIENERKNLNTSNTSNQSMEKIIEKSKQKKKHKKKCQHFKNWAETDDLLLRRLFVNYGNKWKIIAKYFPSRTPYQLSYRMKTLIELDEKSKKKTSMEKQKEIFDRKISLISDPYMQISEENDLPLPKILHDFHLENVQNSFFRKINYVNSLLNFHYSKNEIEKKTLKRIKSENALSNLELNEEQENQEENYANENPNDKNEKFSKENIVFNLMDLINDIKYLSFKYSEEDINQHFQILLKNAVRAYYKFME
jgi:hypothetical protein